VNDDHIAVNNGGVSFVGQDATRLYAVTVLRASIKLHRSTGLIPTRGMTITRLFQRATEITGRPYKRGQHDAAIADLTTWINTMKAALPVVDNC
jgi:hypothetical protein